MEQRVAMMVQAQREHGDCKSVWYAHNGGASGVFVACGGCAPECVMDVVDDVATPAVWDRCVSGRMLVEMGLDAQCEVCGRYA